MKPENSYSPLAVREVAAWPTMTFLVSSARRMPRSAPGSQSCKPSTNGRNFFPKVVSLFYVIDTGSIRARRRILGGTELEVTNLQFAFSSDASCADLPLPLLGAPVSIGALVCFFVLCYRHWFNKVPGPDPRGTELEVTYLPSAFSSDASCADLPLPLLGAPVDVKLEK